MRETKTLNVTIKAENHDFINDFKHHLNLDPHQYGTLTQAHVVNLILDKARLDFHKRKGVKK